ncbi:MAG TPA: SRPBCC domain-containing protein [Steroidobacteraceae bacterium]|nr:SRPBCC domain-containing protein [Steroidobacteraceae bacterium]
MKATPDSSDSLVFECDFEEPPEKVWRALTEPELLEAWLEADDSPTHSAGDRVTQPALAPDPVERAPSVEYEIVAAEPHRLLRYRWRERDTGSGRPDGREVDSFVTVELVPDRAGGTHLRLTHGEFRIVSAPSAVPSTTAVRVRPIMRARRRRIETVSFAARYCLRRAA